MTNYETTIKELNNIHSLLESKRSDIVDAASISYESWDSDARKAYQNAISNIERELKSITNEVNSLKSYIQKEDVKNEV